MGFYMTDYIMIMKLQLKTRFSFLSLRSDYRNNSSAFLKKALISLAVIVSFGMLAFFWCFMLYYLYQSLIMSGVGELGLFLPFFAGMITVFIFGIAGVIGILFGSKDIELLAALPLKPGAVFAAKFTLVYLTELAITLFFVAPAIIIYGVLASGGIWFYVQGIFAMLLLPLLPLAVSSVIALIFMRFSVFSRKRETFALVGGIIFVLITLIGQQLLMSNMNSGEITETELAQLIQSSGLLEKTGRMLPPALWAAKALIFGGAEGLINWALYLSSSVLAFALTCLAGSKLYMSGALNQLETHKLGKKANLKVSKLASSSALLSIAGREFKTTIRSSVYALNSLIGVIMFPVMLGVMSFTMTSNAELAGAAELFSQFQISNSMIYTIAVAVSLFVCSTNLAAPTSLSREGKNFWLSKVIPVPYKTQAYGKLIFSAVINMATIILCAAVVCVLYSGLLLPVAIACICGVIASFIPLSFNMMVDICRPKLKWASETEAMKQNMNGFLGMLIGVLFALLIGGICLVLALFTSFLITVLVSFAVACLASVASIVLLGSVAESKYDGIEA
jgi:ABC-2 type transport system permease protein